MTRLYSILLCWYILTETNMIVLDMTINDRRLNIILLNVLVSFAKTK